MALTLDGDNGVSGVNGSAGTPAIQGTDTNTGISFGTDTVNLVTGGTTRATVDSSGRLGIGTSPSYKLHVYDDSNVQGFFNGWSSGGSLPAAGAIRFGNQTGYQGRVDYDPTGSTNYIFENSYTSGSISWKINGSEKMRLEPNGRVLIGKTASSYSTQGIELYPAEWITVTNSNLCLRLNRTGADGEVAQFMNDGTIVGRISVSGSSTSYATSSDYRLKENVVPLTGAADRLNQLQVRRFNFIADPDTTVDGFIAHEAQAVVPECVTGTQDEVDDEGNPVYQGIDQSKLVPLLTAALQEALAKIETLETRLTALEGGTN